jgi:hypothetical protein
MRENLGEYWADFRSLGNILVPKMFRFTVVMLDCPYSGKPNRGGGANLIVNHMNVKQQVNLFKELSDRHPKRYNK